MPALGLGTFGSDNYDAHTVARAVIEGAEIGYRHFDCAEVYGNEAEIGQSLKSIQKSGVAREDMWVTSKVWNNHHGDPVSACENSLRNLGLDYLDLYLIHWPFPNHHEKGVDVNSRDPHAVPFSLDRYMDTWSLLEELYHRGLVRHIGTSNMTISKLTAVLQSAEIKPHANEMEIHPHFQQPDLFDYCVANQIVPIGYSPIGSPSRPERDRTPEDTVDIEEPAILAAANRLGVHPAVVCVLWQVQRGSVPIPFSVKRPQMQATFDAVSDLSLTDEEMEAIAWADRGCRLIKGQVFLWPEANDWPDLWA
ncbi:MAG: aldo/keto reductase [Armatimonadetes bacterium]|nr:aldo/keto reductase [Armatimonadota bacterium]